MVLTKTLMLRLQNQWVTFQQVQPSFIYSLWCHLCLCCYSQNNVYKCNNVVLFCVSSDCNCVNCQKGDKLINDSALDSENGIWICSSQKNCNINSTVVTEYVCVVCVKVMHIYVS